MFHHKTRAKSLCCIPVQCYLSKAAVGQNDPAQVQDGLPPPLLAPGHGTAWVKLLAIQPQDRPLLPQAAKASQLYGPDLDPGHSLPAPDLRE